MSSESADLHPAGSSPRLPPQAEEEEEAMDHNGAEQEEAPASPPKDIATNNGANSSDVERFGGKIVYNPDGSAYIIEDGGDSDDESLANIPKVEGSIVDRTGGEEHKNFPQIENAFYISKSSAYYNALYGQAYVKMMQEKNMPETPVVHSYRVYSPREKPEDRRDNCQAAKAPLAEFTTVPCKPILMCFLCKLSFNCSESFGSHCVEGHNMELNEEEKVILESKNSSAIIQTVGKEQPSVSFLEPVVSNEVKSKLTPPISPGAINSLLSSAAAAANQLPKVPSSSCLPPTPLVSSPLQLVPQSLLTSRSPPLGQTSPLERRSPFSAQQEPNRSAAASPAINSSPSPVASMGSAGSYPQMPTNANMLQGTTIGACPEHVNGRPTGVECSKCDLILNQSRLSGMGWNVSRNSCKTLKCPKCNWHYKYQETLEIHMKEKHPESETTCIYCITGQQHPRLARGETYTCGYKPYRCEVCNYSTTTKGNLSIHMQSDKHLNNMQDLQNGGGMVPSNNDNGVSKAPTTPTTSIPATVTPKSLPSPSTMASPSKQKPSWRCDVCNYETNVARNLRIHMTSEKHTHNMMSLQPQQAGRGLPSLPLPPGFPGMPSPAGLDPQQLLQLSGLFGGAGGPAPPPPTSGASEQVAMADMAYQHALLTQMMGGGGMPGPPPDFKRLLNIARGGNPADLQDNEPPAQPTDPNPNNVFSCFVCRDYGCNGFEDLNQHLSFDRSRTRENEVSIVIAGNYMCQLCNYKTNLKANFQLHCKTDKHLQRLSHVNHIKEGGPANEWKLRFLTSLNPVELHCNACDFYTNSPHKLQVHINNQQHQVSSLLFEHLQKCENNYSSSKTVTYDCRLCQFSAAGKHLLMEHVRSMQHLQMEQVHQLKKRAEGNLAHTEIGDIFQVNEEGNDEAEERVRCPLCPEGFDNSDAMKHHATSVHSINMEGLNGLLMLMNRSKMEAEKGASSDKQDDGDQPMDVSEDLLKKPSSTPPFSYSLEKYMDPNRPFKCEVCRESFTQKNILLVHYNSVSHLGKVKKMKEQDSASPAPAEPERTPTKGSALEALLGNLKGQAKKRDEDEVKPYRCNICKVAYPSGSALDIHLRSSLHSNRAEKLQELILTGQIDRNRPLIETPADTDMAAGNKKNSDMLSPKSVNSTGSTNNSQSSPNVRSSSPNRSSSPHSSPLANIHALMGGQKNALPSTSEGDDAPAPVLKNLLQNYGMELLLKQMQDQKKQKDDEEEAANRATPTSERAQSRPSSQAGPGGSLSDMQEAFQKAMLQAQLQQMNPMMMQMSQLQGLNPLLAMNLHPPLVSPALMKAGAGNAEMSAAVMAQLQSTQQMLGAGAAPPMGLMDPKLLALMANRQQGDIGNPPDLKTMSQLLGLPMPPMSQSSPTPSTSEASSPMPPFSMMGIDSKLAGLQPSPLEVSKMSGKIPDTKALLMQQQPVQPQEQGGKRARTRITDDQLKVLRSHFDINNSPTEDMLNLMAGQTGLPLKVIKHWFRNTLFKERQKNKDSPYNFNNAPTTKLNLEEYEKTGESKVTPMAIEEQNEYIQNEAMKKETEKIEAASAAAIAAVQAAATPEQQLPKSEPIKLECIPEVLSLSSSLLSTNNSEEINATTTNKVPKLTESSSSSEQSLTLSRLLSSQLSGGLPLPAGNLLPNFPAFPSTSTSPLPPTTQAMPDYLNSLANRISGAESPQNSRPLSPQSMSSGKRANRTRFTDYQIKVLQEFFENNAYPKDDDLEYLSKLLGLSPRVIVVWFQNARQKARKIYENQPALDQQPGENDDSGRFTKTAGCNYQCKKCLLVFQRYYELIRHQKQHCYKEEDSKRSALAQKAAAVAAANFSGGSSTGSNQLPPLLPLSEDSNSSIGNDHRSITSPSMSQSAAGGNGESMESKMEQSQQELSDMTKDAVNRMFGGNQFLNYPPGSPFGMLQQQALQQQQQQLKALQQQQQQQQLGNNGGGDSGDELDSASLASSPSSKRKFSEDGESFLDEDGHRDKRLRTTILPEQLDFLYQKYQEDSNPSRKMLEQLAAESGLRKRVVQVWFQNTRARERKGLYKPNQHLLAINKRCPFCPALFKARTALEAHLTSKHPEQPIGIIDIDALPNGPESEDGHDDNQRPQLPESPFAALMPNAAAAAAAGAAPVNFQDSMRKYYEDTMKRFMSDINKGNTVAHNGAADLHRPASPSNQFDMSNNALDLTSNFDESSDHLDDGNGNRSLETDSTNGLGDANGANKRFRTQMSGVQIKMMKAVFEVYKTPTMTECSSLGRDIGLQKRVVQVWFQNARAKEKRAKLQLQQATGQEPEGPPAPEECKICNFKYSHKYAIQDHLFNKEHLDLLRLAIEQGRVDPESPGYVMAHAAAAIQSGGAAAAPGARSGSTDCPPGSLSMLQMQTPVNSRELLEMSTHQNSRMLMQV